MPRYYVNKNAQSSGDNEVHKEGCAWMPQPNNCMYLGVFSNCFEAVREAKKTYPTADGCVHCSEACHTS